MKSHLAPPLCFLAILLSEAVNAESLKASLPQSAICKATIAALMGRNPSIMQVESEHTGAVYITYKRPDDGTRWKTKCKVVGNQVHWGNSDGRWRDLPEDGKVTYSFDGNVIKVNEHFTDGSVSTKAFPKSQVLD
jgi:hypothetical protein